MIKQLLFVYFSFFRSQIIFSLEPREPTNSILILVKAFLFKNRKQKQKAFLNNRRN
jgi:hypothetical protein